MKPTAIIVDIDGTLAHMVDRSPYDPSKYHTDVIDEVIRDHVNRYPYKVIVVSGRDDTYKEVTERWLKLNQVEYDEIFMRPAEDKREDSIVKLQLYKKHIEPHYDIEYVLDDRNRVVKMWRENGLKCLQVAEGDF